MKFASSYLMLACLLFSPTGLFAQQVFQFSAGEIQYTFFDPFARIGGTVAILHSIIPRQIQTSVLRFRLGIVVSLSCYLEKFSRLSNLILLQLLLPFRSLQDGKSPRALS